jgi:hypothetical protein
LVNKGNTSTFLPQYPLIFAVDHRDILNLIGVRKRVAGFEWERAEVLNLH